ncbi:type II secretion system major pseudopilin GspG [Undibacterium flavidum]|uniref:Type II secretion system core protein G n=1 Tax=Undibacterium flavidum TaxID=2762297 RepID=A0ABR6YBZ0_9BURK|nr:type II secretion system major pseudopilin GspG [Undibacterium flavidum]MBC3873834.1 type II secretion system major pseudopilin GspG [Undibacterium flavidum]
MKLAKQFCLSRGFTLLELLVVVAIIAMLAGYVGPKYFAQLGRSEISVAKAQIDAFDKALDQYRLDVGRYPSTEQGLQALMKSSGDGKWAGPYLKKDVPVDPWGHAYQYRAPGANGKDYDLLSYGKDGVLGGINENTDISN